MMLRAETETTDRNYEHSSVDTIDEVQAKQYIIE